MTLSHITAWLRLCKQVQSESAGRAAALVLSEHPFSYTSLFGLPRSHWVQISSGNFKMMMTEYADVWINVKDLLLISTLEVHHDAGTFGFLFTEVLILD